MPHLLAYHGNWYALALNTGKARVETFALSRFRQIATTGQSFTRPAAFSAETYARQAFGIVGGEEPIRHQEEKVIDPHIQLCDHLCGGEQWRRIYNLMIG